MKGVNLTNKALVCWDVADLKRHYNPLEDFMVWTNRDYQPGKKSLKGVLKHNRRMARAFRHTYFGY